MKSVDERYMRMALQFARRGLGRTSPNPAVGAVIVKQGRIVGRGYHRRAGLAHAEVEALRNAGGRARGATLYVTLEPCNHTGRTPPCCDAIVNAGILRVVVATADPNPITNGRGLQRLRRAGMKVVAGILAAEARRLNTPFFKVMTTGLPFVSAKIGQSLDGKIATASGESRWITSPASRDLVHRWRRQADAILVGVNTILRDDPWLSVRGMRRVRPGRPIKVIVDSRLRTPPAARCLSTRSPAPTWIATTATAAARAKQLKARGAELIRLKARRGRVPLRALCRVLAQRGIQSVLMEGGGEVLAGALAERVVDRVAFFVAPRILGGRSAPSSVGGTGIHRLSQAFALKGLTVRRTGPDLCIEGAVAYPRR